MFKVPNAELTISSLNHFLPQHSPPWVTVPHSPSFQIQKHSSPSHPYLSAPFPFLNLASCNSQPLYFWIGLLGGKTHPTAQSGHGRQTFLVEKCLDLISQFMFPSQCSPFATSSMIWPRLMGELGFYKIGQTEFHV